jgi:hypothetical protein
MLGLAEARVESSARTDLRGTQETRQGRRIPKEGKRERERVPLALINFSFTRHISLPPSSIALKY